jgi:hypothetical protein
MDEVLSGISIILMALVVVMTILHIVFADDDEEVDKK